MAYNNKQSTSSLNSCCYHTLEDGTNNNWVRIKRRRKWRIMMQWKFNGLFLLSAMVVYQKLTTIPIKFSFFSSFTPQQHPSHFYFVVYFMGTVSNALSDPIWQISLLYTGKEFHIPTRLNFLLFLFLILTKT